LYNDDGGLKSLSSDDDGLKVRLELLCHETVHTNADNQFVHEDRYALFRVVSISSWEHHSHRATTLPVIYGGWSPDENRMLWEAARQQSSAPEHSALFFRNAQNSNAQVAEIMQKTEREVELHKRWMKRMQVGGEDCPMTSQMLSVSAHLSHRASLRMWWDTLRDETGLWRFLLCGRRSKATCGPFFRDPTIRDMWRYLEEHMENIRDNTNLQDLTEAEANFVQNSMCVFAFPVHTRKYSNVELEASQSECVSTGHSMR
jgi:hypothetical protein